MGRTLASPRDGWHVMYIMVADVSVTAMGKEMVGMLKAIQAQVAPDAAKELVTAVVADIVAKSSNKEKLVVKVAF